MSLSKDALLFDQLTAEWALAHASHASVVELVAHLERRIALLRATIAGFATNGTDCGACQMSMECAAERLAADDAMAATYDTPPLAPA